jgi:hypothetical protein
MGDGVRIMLIKMKAEHISAPARLVPMLFQETWASSRTQLVHKGVVLPHLPKNILPVVVKVGEGGVHLTKRKVRQLFEDLFCRPAMNLGLSINILHADPCPCDERPRLAIAIGP